MVGRAWLLLLVVLAAALAGCTDAGKEGAEEGTEPTPTTKSGAATGGTSAAPTGANNRPTARVVADNVTGRVPMNVTFELTGADPDGDKLSWTFDANGDGKTDIDGKDLPLAFTFLYNATGTFVAKLTVSDGSLEAVGTRNITVNPQPAVDTPDPITMTGTITGAWVQGTYLPDVNTHEFTMDTIVNNMTVTVIGEGTALDLDFQVFDAEGDSAGSMTNYNLPGGVVFSEQEPPLLIQDPEKLNKLGTWKVVVMPGISVEGAYTITITFA